MALEIGAELEERATGETAGVVDLHADRGSHREQVRFYRTEVDVVDGTELFYQCGHLARDKRPH